MLHFVKAWVELKTDRRAVTALEYAIMAGLIGAGLVGMFTGYGEAIALKLTTAVAK